MFVLDFIVSLRNLNLVDRVLYFRIYILKMFLSDFYELVQRCFMDQ